MVIVGFSCVIDGYRVLQIGFSWFWMIIYRVLYMVIYTVEPPIPDPPNSGHPLYNEQLLFP